MKALWAWGLFLLIAVVPPYCIELAWAFATWTAPSANPGDWHTAVRVLGLIWMLWWLCVVVNATKDAAKASRRA